MDKKVITRRKNWRVQYPPFESTFGLPELRFNGVQLKPINISVSGALVQVDANFKIQPQQLDEVCTLEFVWNKSLKLIRQETKIARLDQKTCAFEFVNTQPELITELLSDCKPARRAMGVFMIYPKPIDLRKNAKKKGDLELERWQNMQGDSIEFLSENSVRPFYSAEIKYESIKYLFKTDQGIFQFNPGLREFDQEVAQKKIEEIILLLSNIPQPSEDLQHLLKLINQFYENKYN